MAVPMFDMARTEYHGSHTVNDNRRRRLLAFTASILHMKVLSRKNIESDRFVKKFSLNLLARTDFHIEMSTVVDDELALWSASTPI